MWIVIISLLIFYIDGTHSVEWTARGNTYYVFSSEKADGQSTAQEECQSLNANLLSIGDQDELDFVKARISDRTWIGLRTSEPCSFCKTDVTNDCTICRDKWTWINGEPLRFQNWDEDQPNENTACGTLYTDGEMYDSTCSNSYYFICEKQGACTESICTNGSCVGSDTPYQYDCECKPGFTGRHCETDIDECEYQNCSSTGLCVNSIGSYQCSCHDGWTGEDCNLDIDECSDYLSEQFCQEGTCLNTLGSFNCTCSYGHSGRHCDKLEDSGDLKDENRHHHINTGLIIGISVVSCMCLLLGLAFLAYVLTNKLRSRNDDNQPAIQPKKSDAENNYLTSPDDGKNPCNADETKTEPPKHYQPLIQNEANPNQQQDEYEMDDIYEN